MKKTILAVIVTAAALCAQAGSFELLRNGAGNVLKGWDNTNFEVCHADSTLAGETAASNYWFGSSRYISTMSQTVTLAEFGLMPADIQQFGPSITASVTAIAERGGPCCKVKVYELDESGNVLAENTVMDKSGTTMTSEADFSIVFNLNSGTRRLKYELIGQADIDAAPGPYGPKFRNCSMICQVDGLWRTITFVSAGRTVDTVEWNVGDPTFLPPIALRNENYRFLGYFTEEIGGEQIYDEKYGFAAGAGLSAGETTLYAHWALAGGNEGGVTNLVYRGVLSNFGEWTSGLSKTMQIKVYDSASAARPLWSGTVPDVPINPDGSFEAMFGDADLAMAFASNDVTHVELTVGDALTPIAPRRSFTSVASVNRALVAEGAADDVKIGTLGANAIVAEKVSTISLEASETVRVEGSVSVEVKPFDVDAGRETTIWRGAGVTAWGDSQLVATANDVAAGQLLWTADREGVAVVHATGTSRSTLRIPATIQFVRPGDEVRAPTWENGEVSVTVWGYKK